MGNTWVEERKQNKTKNLGAPENNHSTLKGILKKKKKYAVNW